MEEFWRSVWTCWHWFHWKSCSCLYEKLSMSEIIIIMSCRQHGYPWPSLATSPNRSSPLAGLQNYIPYPHRAAICTFELVVLLLAGPCQRAEKFIEQNCCDTSHNYKPWKTPEKPSKETIGLEIWRRPQHCWNIWKNMREPMRLQWWGGK